MQTIYVNFVQNEWINILYCSNFVLQKKTCCVNLNKNTNSKCIRANIPKLIFFVVVVAKDTFQINICKHSLHARKSNLMHYFGSEYGNSWTNDKICTLRSKAQYTKFNIQKDSHDNKINHPWWITDERVCERAINFLIDPNHLFVELLHVIKCDKISIVET